MKINSKKFRFVLVCLALVVALTVNCVFVTIAADPTVDDGETSVPTDWDLTQIVLDKSVSVNPKASDDDVQTYKLSIDTFVSGDVIWEETVTEVPNDVVLVLDVSGSMDKDMGPNDSTDRIVALRKAVKKFIADMSGSEHGYDRYNIADHRISLVSFSSSEGRRTKIVRSWTPLDKNGVTTLNSDINNLSTGGDTAIDEGLEFAQQLLDPKQDYSLTNAKVKDGRKKAVVVFTDGVPNHGGTPFETSVADDAVKIASDLKKDDVTVFSVGIFSDADASQLYADSAHYGSYNFIHYASSGAVGEYWEAEVGNEGSDHPANAAANRMLNFISSNYKSNITSTCLTDGSYTRRWDDYYKFTINYCPTAADRNTGDYYYTATNSDELSYSFVRISQWIAYGGTSVELNERSVVKDIVSDYFELPANTKVTDIKTYTAKCNGIKTNASGEPVLNADGSYQYTFDALVPTKGSELFSAVTATITDFSKFGDKRDISVTGFDFTDNFVAYDIATKRPHGYKLVIQFDIEPIEGFNGGNNVPTNHEASGIYREGDTKPIKPYNVPELNLPIPTASCELKVSPLVIYRGCGVPAEVIMEVVHEGNPINDAFINREVIINGVTLKDGIFAPTVSTYYGAGDITIKLTPKSSADGESVGEAATPTVANTTDGFWIYVKKPTVDVTMNDVQKCYGEEYTLGDGANASAAVTWDVPELDADHELPVTEGIEAPFTVDDIVFDYTNSNANLGVLPITKKDESVKVEALFKPGTYEDTSITKVSQVADVNYSVSCTYGCTTPRVSDAYIVHSETCTLTINSSGGTANDTFVYNVLKDGVPYTSVTVSGGDTAQSVVLKDLPQGTYQVVLSNTWDWRFTPTFDGGVDTAALDLTNPDGTVKVTNASASSPVGKAVTPIKNVYGVGKR